MRDKDTPTGELRDVDVQFVSLVSKAANKRTFKIFKSAAHDEQPETLEQDETKQAVSFMKMMKNFFTGGTERSEIVKADTIVPDFATALKVDQIQMWKVWDAISDVFWGLIRSDNTDKRSLMEQSLLQFNAKVLEHFDTLTALPISKTDGTIEIEKAGAKISAARLQALKDARTYLDGVIADAEPAAETAAVTKTGEDEIDMKPEELQAAITKAVSEAVAPIQTKLEAIEKGEKPAEAPAAAAATELTPENIASIVKSAVDEAVKPVADRVQKMENVRGISNQDVEGGEQHDITKTEGGSVFAGLFSV